MKWSNVRNAPRNGRLKRYQDNRNPRKNNSKVKPRSSKKVPNRKEKIERDRGKGGKKRRVQYLRWQHPRNVYFECENSIPPNLHGSTSPMIYSSQLPSRLEWLHPSKPALQGFTASIRAAVPVNSRICTL